VSGDGDLEGGDRLRFRRGGERLGGVRDPEDRRPAGDLLRRGGGDLRGGGDRRLGGGGKRPRPNGGLPGPPRPLRQGGGKPLRIGDNRLGGGERLNTGGGRGIVN